MATNWLRITHQDETIQLSWQREQSAPRSAPPVTFEHPFDEDWAMLPMSQYGSVSAKNLKLRRLGSHCVGRVSRLVRAASPLGRSKWRLRNETQHFRGFVGLRFA
ncbi:hypothetical protein LC653_11180 [Nostoc sp. CHAB 5784]|uniref:hypothetical protein n=1 Tax=Nostoc mirabile TaxID=2907820 RepID=UPI001E306C94|nr:hypothetical protein [Nostoc mirabile]MCC5664463.1 hypothetical protein [Nostoc mirabile CHAB5784]